MKGIQFLTANALANQAEQEAIDDNKPMTNPNIPRPAGEESVGMSRAKSSLGTLAVVVVGLIGTFWLLGHATGEKMFSLPKGGVE